MTDRELLMAAAKAAGIKIDKSPYNGGGAGNTGFDICGNAVLDWHNDKRWNPLTDDGDALRLVVKLRIQIEWTRELSGQRRECYQASPRGLGHLAEFGLVGDDPAADIRRAIVRAAAAMGEARK